MSGVEISAARDLRGVRVLAPRRHADHRGFLSEVWREDALLRAGINCRFVQENHVFSHAKGTVRGLHFQVGNAAQAKLVRCARGAVLDVALDVRAGSPTFGRHVALELSAQNWKQIYVPVGFAHGFCTLSAESEVIYKMTAYHDPASERGVAWDDPALAIAWPVEPGGAVLSERDRALPPLAELPDFFPYSEHAG
jgi:dTDP-4-dehydrorhamnose 3,5-epimerase